MRHRLRVTLVCILLPTSVAAYMEMKITLNRYDFLVQLH